MKFIPAYYLAGTFIAVSLLSCTEKKAEVAAVNADVNVVAVGQKTVPVFSEYVGETFGQEDIQIQSRVDGWITGIHFKEGDMVQKGQLLYTVDDLPIKNKIDQAQAKLAEANTGKVRNKSELDRVEPLTAMHALSQRDLDAAKAGYQASISQVDAAEAALRNAKIELEYTHITSPITGVIGVRFSISEDEYLKFAKAKTNTDHKILQNQIPVQLVLSDGSVYPETGTISLSNRQIDPATGSLLIQAVFPNAQNLLRPGQYAKIRLQTDVYKDAILVPQQAVNQIQNIYQVFVVNDSNMIRPAVIKVGKRVGSNWIVQEGLQMGTKVAIIGNAVVNNPKVAIKPSMITWNYDSTSIQ